MLTAFETVAGYVTVMVFPATRAVVTGAEKTSVRTPLLFNISTSLEYELDLVSATLTVPAFGSIAN